MKQNTTNDSKRVRFGKRHGIVIGCDKFNNAWSKLRILVQTGGYDSRGARTFRVNNLSYFKINPIVWTATNEHCLCRNWWQDITPPPRHFNRTTTIRGVNFTISYLSIIHSVIILLICFFIIELNKSWSVRLEIMRRSIASIRVIRFLVAQQTESSTTEKSSSIRGHLIPRKSRCNWKLFNFKIYKQIFVLPRKDFNHKIKNTICL